MGTLASYVSLADCWPNFVTIWVWSSTAIGSFCTALKVMGSDDENYTYFCMTCIKCPFCEPIASLIYFPTSVYDVAFNIIYALLFAFVISKCAFTKMHPSFTKLYDYSSMSFVAKVPCKLSTENMIAESMLARSQRVPPSERFSL